MIRLYLALTFGHFRRHRLEFLLCILGVSLGVSVAVAIDAAVGACVSSFRGAVQSLAERSTHGIFAADGTIRDQQYIDLVQRKLSMPLAPMIDRGVLAAAGPGAPVVARLIGVDVFAERPLRSFTQFQSSMDEASRRQFLTEPSQVMLVDTLAGRLGAKKGDDLRLTIDSHRVVVHVCGVVQLTGVARSQLSDLIVCDIATAQELTGALGLIDRIDVRIDTPEQERLLAAALAPGLELRSTRQQSTSLENLIGSYRMNLGALSLMASFVAVFIVYNSMLVSVQQRSRSLGILRSLGASNWQLGGLYFAEGLIFAIVGATIGVAAGAALSHAMVGYIATTINDLYAAVRPAPVALDRAAMLKGAAISFGSCLLGAAVPLVQASRLPPVNAFRPTEKHRAAGPMVLRLFAAGGALLASAWGILWLPSRSPVAGFVMAILIALGFALLCPWLTRRACSAVEAVARPMQWLPLQMAAAGVGRSLEITGVAVAATMLAMAMNISVRTMVFSFRTALGSWMEQRFATDVLVGPELLVNHKIDATLDPRAIEWIQKQPDVALIVKYRMRNIEIVGRSTMLVGTDVKDVLQTLPMKQRLGGEKYDPATDALISEPLAGRTLLKAGQMVSLQTPKGARQFRVYGIYYDFGTERGQVMLNAATLAEAWDDPRINSLHVSLVPGNDPDQTAARWSAVLRSDYPVVVNSSRNVRTEIMAVFDRTFAVTEVLTWLAGGVAFCGLAGSLLALALARQRDYSVLAAVGMTGRQTIAWVLYQGTLIAWTAAAVACAAGTLLAFVLAYVVQYRSFGWSIPTRAQPHFWVQNFALATVAAAVAAIYPAIRLRRTRRQGG